ncbi:triosephosphate isomerase [Microbacterium sp. AISO3]|jgi:triosephosphate isomerase (TIM)|uniref:Triosephosphate isomerase n=1 Tax=Microbacterium arborescens TaxID=33883 RepID=A0ABX2WI24_9MICO|nr:MULTISPECIES: triose-phosphate isomerase family protein [Microbacterium]OAZ40688.1 triose-phosphate isomerase [Microbacterium arborescens]OWP20616.1 triosephosphate isomerase [Microbacterium sp. AISO3]QCR39426.1 triosephosphate isomerase [Microbacterium sp. SGAir0570]
MTPMTVGVSLKAYFGRRAARVWFGEVAAAVSEREAVRSGAVEVFVIPTYLQFDDARDYLAPAGVRVGVQDVSAYEPGAYTGEITAAEVAESGGAFAEIGHAERRRLFGETDEITAAKAAAALRHGVTPVLCIGEPERTDAESAARTAVAQLHADLTGAPAGRVVVAYEPVWAIGAPEPAPTAHIVTVSRALRAALDADPERAGSSVIYGGSAGPGLLARLEGAVDGLFLGRFAHDAAAFGRVIDEAAELAAARSTQNGATS